MRQLIKSRMNSPLNLFKGTLKNRKRYTELLDRYEIKTYQLKEEICKLVTKHPNTALKNTKNAPLNVIHIDLEEKTAIYNTTTRVPVLYENMIDIHAHGDLLKNLHQQMVKDIETSPKAKELGVMKDSVKIVGLTIAIVEYSTFLIINEFLHIKAKGLDWKEQRYTTSCRPLCMSENPVFMKETTEYLRQDGGIILTP